MKSRGETARAGDIIPYIFCLGPGGESSKNAQADRARHPYEVRKAENNLQIGILLHFTFHDTLSIAKDEPLGLNTPSSSSSGNNFNISALERDGSLRFFWFDYLEHEGKLYFIGKLKKDKVWVSCCVTVEGLRRNLFVLLR
jgi:hypothetical protein